MLWTAEEKQLQANPKRPAQGTVIEGNLDKKIGPVASVLVQNGVLRTGDVVRAGAAYGRVRSLLNDLGKAVSEAGPSIAVQLVGLNAVPSAGEELEVCASESEARERAEAVGQTNRQQRISDMSGGGSMVTLSSLATVDDDTDVLQRMNIIIKADTSGMVEAIKGALMALPQDSVTIRILLAGTGDITPSDVDLAAASSGMVVGFNLAVSEAVEAAAKRVGVVVASYDIIYALLDDVKAMMEGKLKAIEERVTQGRAEVKALFGSGKRRACGVGVLEGKLVKGAQVEVKRGKAIVFTGKLSSLRRVKDVVSEVEAGLECGVQCDEFWEWQVGDKVECFMIVTKARKLEDAKAATAIDVASLS